MAKKTTKTITEDKIKVEDISTPKTEKTKAIKESLEIDNSKELELEKIKLELEKEKLEIEKQKAEIQLEMEKMKLFMATMQNNNQDNKEVEDEELEISCNMIYGISLESQNKDVQMSLKYNQNSIVLESDFKKLIRKVSIRKLFEDGIVYFVDESNYKKFGINNYNDISDKKLKEILKENISTITSKFNELTQNKKNINVLHSLLYRICRMIKDNEINDLSYGTRKSLEEDYFKIQFDKGISYLIALENK